MKFFARQNSIGIMKDNLPKRAVNKLLFLKFVLDITERLLADNKNFL